MQLKPLALIAALSGICATAVLAQKPVPPASPPRLSMGTVFIGESKFHAVVAKAERENWRALPLSERTVRCPRARRHALRELHAGGG